ncbi:MAG: S24 family peptidase [Cyanobacteria bacterium P01_D01_bin.115]
MGFPVPGDAIEESLDLNRHLIHNLAATFFMKVEGDAAADASVLPSDLLVVDRSLEAQNQSLVVGVIEGQMVVLRVLKQGKQLLPAANSGKGAIGSLEIWGVVTNIIRKV